MNNADYNSPNTRARIAARRAARKGGNRRTAGGGSQVRPGARRVVGRWLVTGQLFSALLFAASGAALYHLFTSPSYQVRRVEVRGNTALSNQTVAELTGLEGVPVWFADTTAATERLLASAYVEQASVSVNLPDTAVVTLVERQPDVRWQVGALQYLVDATGKVLDVANTPPPAGTLVIVDSGARTLAANDQLDPDALKLGRVLSLRLPQELRLPPQTIGWDIALGIYVKTAANQTIVFGQTEDLDRKILILGHLLKEKTAFTYLDLRPSNPFYRNGEQAAAPAP